MSGEACGRGVNAGVGEKPCGAGGAQLQCWAHRAKIPVSLRNAARGVARVGLRAVAVSATGLAVSRAGWTLLPASTTDPDGRRVVFDAGTRPPPRPRPPRACRRARVHPRPAARGLETPDGHAIQCDENGAVIGLTLLNVRRTLEQVGRLTLPPEHLEADALKPILAAAWPVNLSSALSEAGLQTRARAWSAIQRYPFLRKAIATSPPEPPGHYATASVASGREAGHR